MHPGKEGTTWPTTSGRLSIKPVYQLLDQLDPPVG
jgi:hypothetical protein